MGTQSQTANTSSTMKFFILSLLASCAVASPALNRDDECPTLEQLGKAFEEHFKVKIPDGILDCLHGGDKCPFTSFQKSTGIKIPDVDINVDELMGACMSGSEACPTLEDAVKFVQNELGADLDDEAINGIYKCAPEILSQLGFAKK